MSSIHNTLFNAKELHKQIAYLNYLQNSKKTHLTITSTHKKVVPYNFMAIKYNMLLLLPKMCLVALGDKDTDNIVKHGHFRDDNEWP